MTTVAEHAPDVRARGLSPLWACFAVAFLVVSLIVGVVVGPVDLGVGAVLESAAARLHVPGFSTSLSPTDEAILWEIRVPRVVLTDGASPSSAYSVGVISVEKLTRARSADIRARSGAGT